MRNLDKLVFRPPHRLMKNLAILSLVTGIVSFAGLVLAPERGWPNFLLAAQYLLGLALAGAVFIAILYVSNAGWATAIRRVPEAMTVMIPVAGAMMVIVLFGLHRVYDWSHEAAISDPLLRGKSGWLNPAFFSLRTAAYILVWLAFAVALVRNSRKQDATGDLSFTKKNKALSAAFLVVFGLSFPLASMDWIMSLEPHWYSTIFGVYAFSGAFLNGLATVAVLVILLRRWGAFQGVVSDSTLHDLGKLVFAFSTFWMYIWFSQYILTWYANIPEEVVYYVRRERGSWLIFTFVNVLLNWVVPFVALLPIWTKKHEGVLLRVCMLVMVGHWVDLFWMILPPFMPENAVISLWELAPIVSVVSGFFYGVLRVIGSHRLIPEKDPYIIESLSVH
jgi:hypothetical protein